MSRLSPQGPGQNHLVYCLSPALHNIFHMPVTRYSLSVPKVLLNTNQPTNHQVLLLVKDPTGHQWHSGHRSRQRPISTQHHANRDLLQHSCNTIFNNLTY